MSQKDLVQEFFTARPNKEISHPEAVDWLTSEYRTRTGKSFRDPDRAIRKLYQEGFLLKIRKGVYKYDPSLVRERRTEDFTEAQKREIFKLHGRQCALCGATEREGAELHIDHVKPKERGGKAEVENGQVLCSRHNFFKRHFSQTETGKRMFIRLYEAAKKIGDLEVMTFASDILEVYGKHKMNGHVEWGRKVRSKM